MSLRDRLAQAMNQRLQPRTAITVPALAAMSGFGEATIRRVRNSHTTHIDVEMLLAIDGAFARWGYPGLFNEVVGPMLAQPAAPGTRVLSDQCWWITAEGRLAHAPFGHGAYVVEAMDTAGVDGDWAAYGLRALGWIALTQQADGRVLVQLGLPRVAPAALARAGDWLAEPRGVLAGLDLRVLDRGQWSAQSFDTITGAQNALARIALLDGAAAPQTTSLAAERRALDLIGDTAMARTLAAWSGPETPAAALRAALGADVARAALFGADAGGGYRAATLGQGITGIGADIVGRNLRTLFEPRYWSLVEGHLAQAQAEAAPTLHRIAVATATDRGGYDRLALPVRDDDGAPAVQIVSHIHLPPQATVLH